MKSDNLLFFYNVLPEIFIFYIRKWNILKLITTNIKYKIDSNSKEYNFK